MDSIGIFGGTFDPPHLAHLVLAAEAQAQLGLERVLWVVTPDPPHKQGRSISPVEDRLRMVELAITGNPGFHVSTIELKRPGPHYALDTVQLLAKQIPGCNLVYLMGGDSLRDLPTWHRPAELLAALDALGVMRRPGDVFDLPGLEEQLPGLTAKVRFVEAPLLEISARTIRERVAAGRSYRYFLPDGVYRYIQDHRLYRD